MIEPMFAPGEFLKLVQAWRKRNLKRAPRNPPNRMEIQGRTLKIYLPNAQPAFTDARFYETLRHFRWHYSKGTLGYARTQVGPRCRCYLHHMVFFLTGTICFEEVDHIDRDTLNNRRENLRPVTRLQNIRNRSFQRNSLTGIEKLPRGWRAKYRNKHLGVFDSAEAAAAAYKQATSIQEVL